MKIYTLVGPSGTGKSFHAMELTEKYHIDSMIDDGLFIYRGQVLAGISAKKSQTKIGAIRIALIEKDEIRDEIMSTIFEKKPDSILVLGTSIKMVDKIILRLGLTDSEGLKNITRVSINDITTEREREIAYRERNIYGKHVVPAPSMELKENFAGYFMDPLKLLKGRKVGMEKERTVVRPPFSYMGGYVLEEKVIDDIIRIVAKNTHGIERVIYIGHISRPESYELSIALKVSRKADIMKALEDFQKEVNDQIENMTAFNIHRIDCEARDLV